MKGNHDEQTFIDTNLENQFKKKALPHIPIVQSRPFMIRGKHYQVVAQYALKSPLPAYFDIYDESGIRANEKHGHIVFKNISMLQIAAWVSENLHMMDQDESVETADIPDELLEVLKTAQYKDVLMLLEYNPLIDEKMTGLHEAINEAAELDEWNEDDLHPFRQAWTSFWDVFDERLQQLLVLRDLVIQHKLTQNIKGTKLQPLYEEADAMFKLFAGSIPVGEAIITNSDDIVTLNYELGRAQQPILNEEILTKFELFSNTLFKRIYQLLLWLFLPISIILTLIGFESIRFPITAAFFVFFALYVYTADVNGMRANIPSRLKDYRRDQLSEQPIIQAHYQQALASFQAQKEREQDHEQIDTFNTVLARPVRWLIGTGIVILILGWALISADEDSSKYAPGYFAVGGSLVVFGVLLPYWSIGKRKFQLAHDKLIIGKREHQTDKIRYIEMKRKGKIVKVLTTHVQQPMLFKVKKDEREEALKLLKHWCDVYGVYFDE